MNEMSDEKPENSIQASNQKLMGTTSDLEMHEMTNKNEIPGDHHLNPGKYTGVEQRSQSFTIDEQSIYSTVGANVGGYGVGKDGQGLHMQLADASISIDDSAMRKLTVGRKKGYDDDESSVSLSQESDSDSEEGEDEMVDPDEIIIMDPDRENQHKEVIDKINELHRQNPENFISQTGALIQSIISIQKKSSKFPKQRGNTRCFWYADMFNNRNGEPMFVIGPNWKKSLFFITMINILVGIGIDSLDHGSWIFHFLYLGMILWNLASIYLIVLNPGLAPLDPNIHTKVYLREVAARNMITALCTTCNIIERQEGEFRMKGYCRTVEHCPQCDVCVEGHDHHNKWIGKCIGYKLQRLYTAYLVLSILQAFSFIFSLLMFLNL